MANWRHQGVYLCHTWNRRRTQTNNSPCNDRSSRTAATQHEDSSIKQWPATCQGSYQSKEVWNVKGMILEDITRQTLHDEPRDIEKAKQLWDIDVSDKSKPSCVQENSSPQTLSVLIENSGAPSKILDTQAWVTSTACFLDTTQYTTKNSTTVKKRKIVLHSRAHKPPQPSDIMLVKL